jgi:hypothetical protein
MTTTMTTAAHPATPWPQALRRILVGLALVVLLAAAFTVGHLTAGNHQAPATAPITIQTPTPASGQTGPDCRAGHLR